MPIIYDQVTHHPKHQCLTITCNWNQTKSISRNSYPLKTMVRFALYFTMSTSANAGVENIPRSPTLFRNMSGLNPGRMDLVKLDAKDSLVPAFDDTGLVAACDGCDMLIEHIRWTRSKLCCRIAWGCQTCEPNDRMMSSSKDRESFPTLKDRPTCWSLLHRFHSAPA